MNVARWNLRVANIKPSEGTFVPSFDNSGYQGYQVSPGTYSAKLTYGDYMQEYSFNVLKDPRDEATKAQVNEQQEITKTLYNSLLDLNESLGKLKQVRNQVNRMIEREQDDEEIEQKGNDINEKIDNVENELVSPKQETFQDIINYRNKLDVQIYQLMQSIDGSVPPLTTGEKELYNELQKGWESQKKKVEGILNDDIPAFNKFLEEKGIEYIAPKKEKDSHRNKNKPTT